MATKIMLGVNDVEKSSAWFQELFAWQSNHGGPHFESLVDADKKEMLLLHHLESTETNEPIGRGVTIYVNVPNVEHNFAKAQKLGAHIVAEPHFNELSHVLECTFVDLNGYTFTMCQEKNG